MENSNLLSLNWKDIVKACFTLFLTTLVMFVYGFINKGELPTLAAFVVELKIAGLATIAYLIKQILSGTTGIPFSKGDA